MAEKRNEKPLLNVKVGSFYVSSVLQSFDGEFDKIALVGNQARAMLFYGPARANRVAKELGGEVIDGLYNPDSWDYPDN